MRHFMRSSFFLSLLFLIFFLPLQAQSSGGPAAGSFDLQGYLLSLLANGGLGMVLSGLLSARYTGASGLLMILQTIVVSLILTAGASILGLIPVPISDIMNFLKAGLANGLLSMLLYKSGILDSLLETLKAKSAHQIAQQ